MNVLLFPLHLLAYLGGFVAAFVWSPFAIVLGAFEAAWKGAGEHV